MLQIFFLLSSVLKRPFKNYANNIAPFFLTYPPPGWHFPRICFTYQSLSKICITATDSTKIISQSRWRYCRGQSRVHIERSIVPSLFLSFQSLERLLKLRKVAWHYYDQKLRCYLGKLKNWNCKSWENARTSHNERFNFHSIWFINEGKIFQITGTRPQLASGHFKLHTSLLALYWPQKIKIWRHKTKNI